MTSLQKWLTKPYAKIRIDTRIHWPAWTKAISLPFGRQRSHAQRGLQVLDRLSLGGKKALLLVSVGERRVLVGVGDTEAPVIVAMDGVKQQASSERVGGAHAPLRRRIRSQR